MVSNVGSDNDNLLIGIGDLHGSFTSLSELLAKLNEQYMLFQSSDSMLFKPGVSVVFTGDYIDRGKDGLKVIDYIQALETSNPWNVKAIIGNHELLALAALDKARHMLKESSNKKFVDVNEYIQSTVHGRNGGLTFLREFGDSNRDTISKTSLETYVRRMSREGDVGYWMRRLEPFYFVNFEGKKILFSHADISDELGTPFELKNLSRNYAAHMNMRTEVCGGSDKKYLDPEMLSINGPFWNRRFRYATDEVIIELMNKLKVDYLVNGHTPQDDLLLHNNKIFKIDVGMVFGKEPKALIMKKDGAYRFGVNSGEVKLVDF